MLLLILVQFSHVGRGTNYRVALLDATFIIFRSLTICSQLSITAIETWLDLFLFLNTAHAFIINIFIYF